LRIFALDFWNGTQPQCEAFRITTGITYPCLMLAGANGVGTDYDTSYDAFFVLDGDGIIRYRRTNDQGPPSWREEEVRPVVDQLLADLTTPVSETPDLGFELLAAYPNPFNPATTIAYTLKGEGGEVLVRLEILDLRGGVVRTLVSQRQATGHTYRTIWDGRDEVGKILPSGMYLSNLTVAGQSQARFLTLVK